VENLRNIDLNLLFVLDALLQTHSVSQAAVHLGLSTPAVSRALARLRTAFGDPLLVRAGRAMVPSPLAEQLQARVQAILHELERVFEPSVEFAPARSNRRFVVLASDYVLLVLGPALDRLVCAQAPEVRLQFMPNTQGDADAIRTGSVDLAIGVYDRLHPEIRIQKLFDEELVCVVRNDHPSVRKKISLRQYTELAHIQVAPRGQPGGTIDDALAEQGLQRRVVRQVPYFVTGLLLASTSDYVMTIPRRLAATHAKTFGFRILTLPLQHAGYAIAQIWHPRNQGDAGLRWFRECVVQACRATRGNA